LLAALTGAPYAGRYYLHLSFAFSTVDTFFQFRSPEVADHCHTDLQQEGSMVQANTRWNGTDGSHLDFIDYFMPGMQLTYASGKLHHTLKAELEVERPWIGMLYQFDGALHSKACARRPMTLANGQQNIVGDETNANFYTFQPQDKDYQTFTVHLTHEFFHQLVSSNAEWMGVHERWLSRAEPFVMQPNGLAATPTAQVLIQQIANCPYSGPLKKMFVEARFLDLFIEQQEQFARMVTRMSTKERDLFYGIRAYLDQHYVNPPSLLDLARQFGTNDFKLKKGFKQLFGTTVFGYVAERRLTVAQQLLTLTDQPVQLVAESVGFANQAHFATAFRKKFGVSPSQVRRNPAMHKAAEASLKAGAPAMFAA
jgi:AraC-like DNA-binding protein